MVANGQTGLPSHNIEVVYPRPWSDEPKFRIKTMTGHPLNPTNLRHSESNRK